MKKRISIVGTAYGRRLIKSLIESLIEKEIEAKEVDRDTFYKEDISFGCNQYNCSMKYEQQRFSKKKRNRNNPFPTKRR